jgi:hypothetical protein
MVHIGLRTAGPAKMVQLHPTSTLTDKRSDLLVLLDLLVKSLDILGQRLEILGGLLQCRQVGRSSVGASQRVELDRWLGG